MFIKVLVVSASASIKEAEMQYDDIGIYEQRKLAWVFAAKKSQIVKLHQRRYMVFHIFMALAIYKSFHIVF